MSSYNWRCILFSFLIFALTVLILVGLHELGHFVAAKWMGVKVLRFSIGFGKPMIRWKGKDETEYVVGWLPLGGYVRMLNSREENVSLQELHRALDQQPLWRRTVIVAAGPITNLVFAVFAFFLTFTLGKETIKPIVAQITPSSIASAAHLKPSLEITYLNHAKTYDWGDVALQLVLNLGNKGTLNLTGQPFPSGEPAVYALNLATWKIDPLKPNLIKSLGIEPYRPEQPAIIHEVKAGGPAAKAGMKVGERIVALDGKTVKDWPDLVHKIWENPGKEVLIKVESAETHKAYSVQIDSHFSFKQFKKIGYIGIVPITPQWPAGMKYERKYPVYLALWPALEETFLLLKVNAITLGKVLIGKISLKNLGGPLLIYQAANLAFKEGFVIFLNFLGLVSVMLGFVNLLPIPGLDGGYLLYFAIEKIRGKALSIPLETLLVRLGVIVLVVLMVQVTINDLLRLVS